MAFQLKRPLGEGAMNADPAERDATELACSLRKKSSRLECSGGITSVTMVRPVRLFDFPFSGNGYKIRLALSLLRIRVEYRVVDILRGESRTPEFLSMNPSGQVPVLELSDGSFLWESNSILFWLAEGTWLMPSEPMHRAKMIRWMCFEQNRFDKVLGRAKFLKAFPEFRPTTEHEFAVWRAEGHAALAILNAELEHHLFAAGPCFSAADVCLFGYVHSARDGGFDLDRFPAILRWLERVREQPGFITIDDY